MNEAITSKNELNNMCVDPVEITWNGKSTLPLKERLNNKYNIGRCVSLITPLEIILSVEKYLGRRSK